MFTYLKLKICIIIALTETCISNDDSNKFVAILHFGNTLDIALRQTNRSGGVGFIT